MTLLPRGNNVEWRCFHVERTSSWRRRSLPNGPAEMTEPCDMSDMEARALAFCVNTSIHLRGTPARFNNITGSNTTVWNDAERWRVQKGASQVLIFESSRAVDSLDDRCLIDFKPHEVRVWWKRKSTKWTLGSVQRGPECAGIKYLRPRPVVNKPRSAAILVWIYESSGVPLALLCGATAPLYRPLSMLDTLGCDRPLC